MTICSVDCVTDVTDVCVTDCTDLNFLNCPTDVQSDHCNCPSVTEIGTTVLNFLTVTEIGTTGSPFSTVEAMSTVSLNTAKGNMELTLPTFDCWSRTKLAKAKSTAGQTASD